MLSAGLCSLLTSPCTCVIAGSRACSPEASGEELRLLRRADCGAEHQRLLLSVPSKLHELEDEAMEQMEQLSSGSPGAG